MKHCNAPPVMDELFGHHIVKTKRCRHCNATETSRVRRVQVLRLPLKSLPETASGRVESPGVRKALQADAAAVSLGSCLDSYFAPQSPEGFKCETCNKVGTTVIRDQMSGMPECLLIGLNRYEYDMASQSSTKATNRIVIEKVLDMAPLLDDETPIPENGALYDCYGMQRHFGRTLNGGHYTARIRTSERGEKPADEVWLDFDDDTVSEVPPRSDGRRWQDSQRFASHLLYSVCFVKREEQSFEDAVPLVRTASCFVEDHSGTKYTGLPGRSSVIVGQASSRRTQIPTRSAAQTRSHRL